MFVRTEQFTINGQGNGEFGQALQKCNFDPGLMRPFFNKQGKPCVTINIDGKYKTMYVKDVVSKYQIFSPVFNNTSLRKGSWIEIDKKVLRANRQRLRAYADLAASASVGGFDAMSKMTYEYEAMNDPGEAMEDMDGLGEGRNDMPQFALSSIPLTITYVDFSTSMRKEAAFSNSGMPFSATMFEAAARRIGERVEKNTIGTVTGMHYGTQSSGYIAHRANSQVYGYTTFPQRITKTNLTVPDGTNSKSTVADVLTMRQLLYAAKFYGPFMLYHSDDWDTYLDNDYSQTAGTSYGVAPTKTLRQRLREIEGIQDVRRLDFLTSSTNPFTLLMVQMTSEVAEAIDAVQPKTIQWTSKGGWQLNFRVYAIQVPLLRYDFNGNCGIVHATTS